MKLSFRSKSLLKKDFHQKSFFSEIQKVHKDELWAFKLSQMETLDLRMTAARVYNFYFS